ncbi:MAG: membrane dipeptidase [Clostridia bacterium]|nr:membrane dipeptidase [Clostridia bacterium]
MIICDTHADTLYRRCRQAEKAEEQAEPDITVEKLKQGQISVQTMALFVGGSDRLPDIARAFEGMFAQGEMLEKKEGLRRVTDYRDAVDGENAFIYSVEGCDLLNGSLEALSVWRQKGVRMAALTWNYENCVATPAKKDADAPLKPFGRKAAREMARLGIAPDTSHLNQRGFYDLLEMGISPVASHSCCRALCDHFRNLSDRQLRDLFQAGGYVGVNFYPCFLREDEKADLDTVCDHVIHILELGGGDHVGFGSDFDGIELKPAGLNGPQDIPSLLKRLAERGVDQAQIRRIAGENLLRYYDRIDPRE